MSALSFGRDIIEVADLCKHYGEVRAVDGVSLPSPVISRWRLP